MVYSKPVLIYFFAIFLLEACLQTIEKQIEEQDNFKGIVFYKWDRTLPGGWSIELVKMTKVKVLIIFEEDKIKLFVIGFLSVLHYYCYLLSLHYIPRVRK